MLKLLKKEVDGQSTDEKGLSVLKIDASARRAGSISRHINGTLLEKLAHSNRIESLTTRDLANGIPLVSEDWIGANFTPVDQRTTEQSAILSQSDELVDELIAADVLLIGLPMYNFSTPASFKAWIDQVARVGRTFQYTENGPVGLLSGKKVIVSLATGGTPSGSPMDFVSAYIRFVLGFMGIEDVTFINADEVGQNADQALKTNGSIIENILTSVKTWRKLAA